MYFDAPRVIGCRGAREYGAFPNRASGIDLLPLRRWGLFTYVVSWVKLAQKNSSKPFIATYGRHFRILFSSCRSIVFDVMTAFRMSAGQRFAYCRPNGAATEYAPSWLRFLTNFRSPLVIVLLVASGLSAANGDLASFLIVLTS
jgi:hypothetical protein